MSDYKGQNEFERVVLDRLDGMDKRFDEAQKERSRIRTEIAAVDNRLSQFRQDLEDTVGLPPEEPPDVAPQEATG